MRAFIMGVRHSSRRGIDSLLGGLVGAAAVLVIQGSLGGAPARAQDERAGDREISVRELRIVDENGEMRASLHATDGGAALVLCDATGRASVDLRTSLDASGLLLGSPIEGDHSRIDMRVDAWNRMVKLNGSDARTDVVISSSRDGGVLEIPTEDGVIRLPEKGPRKPVGVIPQQPQQH